MLFSFPGGASGKELCQCKTRNRHRFNPWVGKTPGKGNGNLLQNSYLENSCGQRRLVGYSLWGHKELDATEQNYVKEAYFGMTFQFPSISEEAA